MKRLLILRHAKSSWSDPALSDFQRPLNQRGQQAAPSMGRWIASHGYNPEAVICSTAARAQQTLELVSAAGEFDCDYNSTDQLYLAPAQTYLDNLAELPDTFESAMVIGHNPGIEALVHQLSGEYCTMPTCALAIITLKISSWTELFSSAVTGQLEHHVLARELER